MAKPKSVMIYGKRVKIKYIKGLIDDDEINGDYCQNKKEIRIDASLRGPDLTSTLIHEIIHAIFDRIGVNQGVDSGVEEVICDSIAGFLTENWSFDF